METTNHLLQVLLAIGDGSFLGELERVRLKTGAVLYEAHDEVDWVYFPERGLVSIYTVMLSGDGAETAVVGCEGAVGFVEAAGSGKMFSRVTVLADLVACRLTAAAYRRALDVSPALARTVATCAELNMTETRQLLACHARHTAPGRLAWWLLEFQDRAGDGNRVPITQEFLALLLGVQRTTLTVHAAALKQARIIKYGRGVITILDRQALEDHACECYATVHHFSQLLHQPPLRRSLRASHLSS